MKLSTTVVHQSALATDRVVLESDKSAIEKFFVKILHKVISCAKKKEIIICRILKNAN